MIHLDQVSFHYGERLALDRISLDIREGEFVGLLGPNSAGKSTLLKLISGALPAAEGRISLGGRPIHAWSLAELARMRAVVEPENYFAFPFTVEQIVLMGRAPHQKFRPWGWGEESPQDRTVAARAMAMTDVSALKDRPIDRLSSGERQRVLLARALAQEPRLLLLDEPTTHLDIGHQQDFFDLLARLHRQEQLTVICALHDLSIAQDYCSRLVCLSAGRVEIQGAPADVLSDASLRQIFGRPIRFHIMNVERTFHETPSH